MSITIICPLYKAERYIDNLHASLLNQKDVEIKEIKYLLTDTKDGLEKKLATLSNAMYDIVTPQEFSHSLTRENAALSAKGEVIVFITQDIIIKDDRWLYKFTKPVYEGKCEAAFSRQICDNESIEKYTRMKNYPDVSRVVTKEDVDRLGILTFFFSDAASCVKASIYIELNGYDRKDLLTNEDMYFSHKLINAGYRIMYNADAVVIHSHDYKFEQLFKRYFDQGVFLKDHSYLLEYKANDSAVALLKFVVANSMKDKNFKAFINIVPNFAARFLGNKFGQNYKKLSREQLNKYSSNKNYWDRQFDMTK